MISWAVHAVRLPCPDRCVCIPPERAGMMGWGSMQGITELCTATLNPPWWPLKALSRNWSNIFWHQTVRILPREKLPFQHVYPRAFMARLKTYSERGRTINYPALMLHSSNERAPLLNMLDHTPFPIHPCVLLCSVFTEYVEQEEDKTDPVF